MGMIPLVLTHNYGATFIAIVIVLLLVLLLIAGIGARERIEFDNRD